MRSALRLGLVLCTALPPISGCCRDWDEHVDFVDEVVDLKLDPAFEFAAITGARSEREIEDGGMGVGAGGQLVVWGYEGFGEQRSLVVELDTLGDADLHDIASTGFAYNNTFELFIVGDAGTIFTSVDGIEWSPIEIPGLSADLWAVTEATIDDRQFIVIVGDEVLLARDDAGVWQQPTPPAAGWGALRAVVFDRAEVFAFGLDARAWSSTDPGFAWRVEDSGATADLLVAGRTPRGYPNSEHPTVTICAGGAQGTLVCHDGDGWRTVDTGRSDAFVAVDYGAALTEDGGLFVYDELSEDFEPVDDYAGRYSAMAYGNSRIIMTQAAGVVVQRWTWLPCDSELR